MPNETRKPDLDARKDQQAATPAESAAVSREQRVASMRERAARAADDLVSHGWKEADRIAASFESPVDDEARKGLAAIESQIRDEKAGLDRAIDRESISPERARVEAELAEFIALVQEMGHMTKERANDALADFQANAEDKLYRITNFFLSNKEESFEILRKQTAVLALPGDTSFHIAAGLLDMMTGRGDYRDEPAVQQKARAFIREYYASLPPGDAQEPFIRPMIENLKASERIRDANLRAEEFQKRFDHGDFLGAIERISGIDQTQTPVDYSLGQSVKKSLHNAYFAPNSYRSLIGTLLPDEKQRVYRVYAEWMGPMETARMFSDAEDVIGRKELYEMAARRTSALDALDTFPDILKFIPAEELYRLAIAQEKAVVLARSHPDAFEVIGEKELYGAMLRQNPFGAALRFPEIFKKMGTRVVWDALLEKDPVAAVRDFTGVFDVLPKEHVYRLLLAKDPREALRMAPDIVDVLPKASVYRDVLSQDPDAVAYLRDLVETLGMPDVLQIALGRFTSWSTMRRALVPLVERHGDRAVFGTVEMQGAPPTFLLESMELFPAVAEYLPWAAALAQLEKIQARAKRETYDPWLTDIDPLALAAYKENILLPDRAEDGAVLVEFAKEFGAVNAKSLLELFVALKRTKSLSELPERLRANLSELLGDARFLRLRSPDAALNAIRQWRRGLTGSLLRDEIPDGIMSVIGREVFRGIKGATQWDRGQDEAHVIGMWEKTLAEKPELGRIPEGYRETVLSIRTRSRERAVGKDEAERELLANKDVTARMRRTFLQSFALGMISRADLVGEGRREVARELFDQVKKTELRIPTLPESAQDGAQKNLARLREQLNGIMRMPEANAFASAPGNDEESAIRLMEAIAATRGRNQEMEAYLRAVSVAHIIDRAPAAVSGSIRKLAETWSGRDGDFDAAAVHEVRNVMVDYLNEHYLHVDQADHQTGHKPFSPDLRKSLAQVWQVSGNLEEHPIVATSERLRAVERGEVAEETLDLSLVPAQGVPRLYAGDIGDACYSSQHGMLAKGGVPDLHAMIFVAGRDTQDERFLGSALFVETETPNGDKVLIVRANNPRQNLFMNVDGDDLVRKTLDEAIETAKRRGIDRVVVPLDGTSQAATNRPDVWEYYKATFSDHPKVGLVDEPETNFNRYAVWNADGAHPVVEIWRKEVK